MIVTLLMGAAAVGMQSPKAQNMQSWWDGNDYPVEAQRKGEVGWVDFALTISPESKVIGCVVELSSGSANLDQPTCDLARKRARVKAATDATGKPILGVFRGRTTWSLPSGAVPRKPLYNQMVVNVQALPAGVVNPSYVALDLSVDTAGKIVECAPLAVDADVIPGRKADFEKSATALGPTACDVTRQRLTLWAAKDGTGAPQVSVQRITVLFLAQ